MQVEIRKISNGYLVMPSRVDRFGDHTMIEDKEIYVFETYQRMVDKLQELLEKERVQS